VVSPPVTRWANSPGFLSLVEDDSEVRARVGARLIRLSDPEPCGPGRTYGRFASGETPRHRDAS